jgi:hypothetical protein
MTRLLSNQGFKLVANLLAVIAILSKVQHSFNFIALKVQLVGLQTLP